MPAHSGGPVASGRHRRTAPEPRKLAKRLPRRTDAPPNRRALEREEARAREAQRRKQDESQQADIAEAVQIIEAWNERLASGRRALFSPTIGAAAIPGYPVADDGYRVQPGERASGRQVRHGSAAMRLLPIETSGGVRSPAPRCPLWRRYREHSGHQTSRDPSALIYE